MSGVASDRGEDAARGARPGRARLDVEQLIVAAGVSAIAALVWHHMAILGDGFWYIATGRLLVEHHRLPALDPFTFASVRHDWRNVSTGSEVLFALVADRLGLRALMALAALVEALAVTLLWLSASRRLATRVLLLPLALLFVQSDAEDLSARGQVFGDLGFVVLLLILFRLRAGRRVHWLVPLGMSAVWVNLHLSFLMVAFVPLLFLGSLLLEPRGARAPLGPFVAFPALGLVGTLANPYGYRYLIHALRCAFAPVVGKFDLFQSPDLHSPSWLAVPTLALALIVARATLGSPRMLRSDVALVVAFLCAACSSRRYVTELLALVLIIAAPLLDRVVWTPLAPVARRGLGVGLSAVLLGGAALGLTERKDPLRDVPAAAASFVTAHALPENVMNPYQWGGYLAYAWRGRPPYFIDGRDIIGLVANGILDDTIRLRTDPSTFARILDAYEIKTVLWERRALLSAYLAEQPSWQLAYQDPVAVVFVRRAPGQHAP